MASVLNKDPASYAKEKSSFLRDLQHFHDTRGTPSRAPPKINGHEIDLYLLYVLVTAQGGWVKVNQRNDWKNLLENFNLNSSCVNAEVALKQIYLRYLDRYEKINFLGETGSIAGDDDEDSRHKKWSARALHSVPLVYNHHQHSVTDQVRTFHGLSTNLYKPSDYDKLSLSLLSPLPNEQDLAINVCILLSNENKHAIKLSKCPKILHHLLAHAGVFTHPASRKYWEEYYQKVRKWSYKTFWKEVLDEKELLYLTDENRFCARTQEAPPRRDDDSSTCSDDEDEIRNKVKLNFDSSDDELFSLKRPLGTDDPYGQRVYQVALILRNLTFFDENMKVMGQDLTFLRFVLLCCATRWNCLHQIGFDMLSNIGPVVPLDVGSLQHATLNIVCKNITESNDRAVILGAVEALNKMGTKESNEEFLLKNINQNVYNKICNMLSLHDIMLLIQTLECLYSLSSLGERACNAIVHVHGVIDTLVSLITVEAQAYGPKACILMRVIETVSAPTSTTYIPEPTTKTTAMAAPSAPPPSVTSQQLLSTFSSQNVLPLPTPAVANPVILPNAPSAVPVMSSSLNTFTSVAPTGLPLVQSVSSPKIIVSASLPITTTSTTLVTSNQTSTTISQPANLIQQENEQFALNWIRATLEVCPTPGRGIDQAELYKLYMTACARAGRRGVIAPLHFPRCVKAVFGPSVGPKSVKLAQSHGGIAMDPPTQIIAYEGIQVRAKPLPLTISSTTMIVTQTSSVVTTPSIPTSPILKAQLSAPAANPQQNTPLIKREILGKTAHNSNLASNTGTEIPVITTVVSSTVSQSDGTMLSNCNTSLIKTLLASKVCDPKSTVPSATIKLSNNESCTLYASSQNCKSTVITEVTQRQQQQQKILQQQTSSVTSPTLPSVVPKQIPKINGIRVSSVEDVLKNDCNIITKSDNQSSVITTIASNNKVFVNSITEKSTEDKNDAVYVDSKKEFLINGTPEISEINNVASKSVTLSGLLDKEIEKKDTPFLYGSIQVGENGLELNGAECTQKRSSDEVFLTGSSKVKQEQTDENGQQLSKVVGVKRPSEEEIPCDQAPKKPHINGNSSGNDDDNIEIDESNVKASSTAANLYAALAADVLEDIDGLEDEPVKPPSVLSQQVQVNQAVTTQQIFQSPGQIIVSSANAQWTSNNQRGIVTMVHQGNASGPQYVLAQPQSALVQGQAQTVLVAQTTPQGSGAKTIIILQQQPGSNSQSPNTVTLSQANFVQNSPQMNQSKVIVQRIPTPPSIKQQVTTVAARPVTPVTSVATKQQQVKVIKTVPHIISATMPSPNVQTKIRTTTPIKATGGEVQTITNQGQFLCEWRGCMRNFKSANEVYMHACESHCPSNGVQEMQCLWERCDSMKRKRFSLMTHLYDRHCNPDVLRMMAVRRRQLSQSGRSEIPAPAPPTPHPGYAPNAAFNAIKRHALEFVNPKELQDDNEGPVTKSIRLTSALILRNLVIYSSTGRWHIKRYEAHLSNIALSNVESSRTIAQLLFDLCHSS
ncbi:AT-rich interactive domain-containing protein 2 isoform X2 [Daktulosphaira vitifoliae]|uniref:AT-rich interactive domain-containing protein 2 isoform X2 n=1 Tax=Daktulosphaira vitifoliae TaxID=58002 RepID=UPI0021AA7F55|nr:AT-rich interactive domain-containing protein 2 isoform X2 [Daktulosphaira vitifoliae]